MAANSSLVYSTAFAILISASRRMSAITAVLLSLGVDDRSDLLTRHHADDGAVGVQAKKDQWELVVARHADRGRVGHLEVARQVLVIGQLVELDGVRVLTGIGRIHPINTLLAHQQHLGADFEGSLSGHGVSGEIGHARARAEDDDPTLLKMPLGTAGYVRLRHLSHGDGGLDPRLNPDLFQKILQGQAVHHCAEHAHVVRSITFHPMLLQLGAAKEIATANDDRHLHAHLDHNADLLGESRYDIGVNAELAATEDLTREFQHHALVRTVHPRVPLYSVGTATARRPPRSVRTAGP